MIGQKQGRKQVWKEKERKRTYKKMETFQAVEQSFLRSQTSKKCKELITERLGDKSPCVTQ